VGDPVYPSEGVSAAPPPLIAARVRGLADLPRLPGSGAEVREVAGHFPEDEREILLRERATLANLLASLAATERRRVVHLACHGFVDAARPRLGGLVLSGGEVLSTEALYRTRVDADLVVLSACDSGRGAVVPGEGLVGLARGFLHAGADRLVVSRWKVEDESTRAFMARFYAGMREEGPAAARSRLTPHAALRRARLERLRAGGPRAHPFHWAAFAWWGL
jgi:CHAT domain-containing protein